ncbi:PRC-barrel domain-containing protein [Streptacidiphilus fuscans]|uniref:PRC-barrel domain containing protein n=1 Tax=Streptacidiphilus fuscans TaxID=2789292 RepID=A0A931B923_9ACTN|nr:PRC-barrel domain-containing protein [Streptacidiphilus fuscans]MBF9069120.1 PRC-barrel domain containing protein [Streptacidiphilus fuscans]
MESNFWTHRQDTGYQPGMNLAGFEVEATDGRIGKVDKHSDEADAGRIAVDTGIWIFGKHVPLPVGTIVKVDPLDRVVYVDRSKDEIKNAPEFDRDRHDGDFEYQQQISAYYAPWLL